MPPDAMPVPWLVSSRIPAVYVVPLTEITTPYFSEGERPADE
jgi:hypothetical protein